MAACRIEQEDGLTQLATSQEMAGLSTGHAELHSSAFLMQRAWHMSPKTKPVAHETPGVIHPPRCAQYQLVRSRTSLGHGLRQQRRFRETKSSSFVGQSLLVTITAPMTLKKSFLLDYLKCAELFVCVRAAWRSHVCVVQWRGGMKCAESLISASKQRAQAEVSTFPQTTDTLGGFFV